jgi:simple sugar transport system ATP-binding protein
MEPHMNGEPLCELRGVCKSFGNVVALDEVTFRANEGEVRGLLGENGAGKSTLMNILYGLYSPDEGEVRLSGKKVDIHSPYDSIRLGIGMVHQASTLVNEFTAVENIIAGTPGDRYSLPLERERKRIASISQEVGLKFPLDTKVKELPAGLKQKIEIIRALYRKARLLILDEVTTCLVEREFQQLLESLQVLVRQGLTVIFITHKIREVLEACDSVTVLRKGRVQGEADKASTTKERLVKMMFIEKDIEVTESALPDVRLPPAHRSDSPVLAIRELKVPGRQGGPGLRGVSLQVYGGEILGVASVSGNGEKELAEALTHPGTVDSGELLLEGKSVRGLSTLELFERGVAYTPEERVSEGTLPEASITENILLGHHAERRFLHGGVLVNWREARLTAGRTIEEYNIHTPSQDLPVRRLSGGNIQKMIIGRAFVTPLKALVAHNPTSGLDISTVKFIFGRLIDTRRRGGAVLWINEDLDELLIISDRIAVLHEGLVKAVFTREQFDKYKIGLLMIGGE